VQQRPQAAGHAAYAASVRRSGSCSPGCCLVLNALLEGVGLCWCCHCAGEEDGGWRDGGGRSAAAPVVERCQQLLALRLVFGFHSPARYLLPQLRVGYHGCADLAQPPLPSPARFSQAVPGDVHPDREPRILSLPGRAVALHKPARRFRRALHSMPGSSSSERKKRGHPRRSCSGRLCSGAPAGHSGSQKSGAGNQRGWSTGKRRSRQGVDRRLPAGGRG